MTVTISERIAHRAGTLAAAEAGTALHRSAPIARAAVADSDAREFSAIGVPYGQVIEHVFGPEQFAPGSVTMASAKLCYRHGEVIGPILNGTETDDGFTIDARISDTALGRDAWTLVRDGVIDRVSIGFYPLEWSYDEDADVLTWLRVEAFEFSLVPWPAYEGAAIDPASLRQKEPPMPASITPEITRDEFDALTNAVTDLGRRSSRDPEAPTTDTRSAAAIVRALAGGDRATTDMVNELYSRDYTGSTTADAIMNPAWVGDLSTLVEDANPLMALFASGVLPPTGNVIEFGQLETNTVKSAKQLNEGDDLTKGKLTFETKSANVHTYGGYVQLTIQEIERSSNAVLDMNLRAQAISAGIALADAFADHVGVAFTAQAANKVIVPDFADWTDWFSGIIAAAKKLKKLGLKVDGLLADEATFEAIGTIKDSSGRPIMDLSGDGSNTAGTITGTLNGRLISIPVACNLDAPADQTMFYNAQAIRAYTLPVARLQNTNAVNLSKDFSVYQYAAFANEVPGAIIPVAKA